MIRPYQPLQHLRLELRPERVMIRHVLRLHGQGDVAVLRPALEIHLVAAEMHQIAHLGEIQQLPVQALEYPIRVFIYGIQLAAVRLAAVGRPRLLIHAQRQLSKTMFRT